MKKWLLAAALCMLAAAFMGGCGKKEEAAPGMEAANADTDIDITYRQLYEANRGGKLLEKYGSVRYELFLSDKAFDEEGAEKGKTETWTLFRQEGQDILMKEMDGKERIVYADGTCYYENAVSEKDIWHGQGWFMNNSYEEFMASGVDAFLLEDESGEDFESIKEEGDSYVIFAYVGESDGEQYYYHYTVDKSSLEIQKFEAVAVAGNGLEWVLSHGEVMAGAQAEIPAYVQEIKQAEQKRLVVMHREKGEDIEVKLPENVLFLAMLEEGYGLFEDKKGEKAFDDTLTKRNEAGVYENVECYLVYLEK